MMAKTTARHGTATRAAWAALVLTLSPLVGAGCGDDSGLSKRYPVKGTVTYNGNKVETGAIAFRSQDPKGRDASGTITNGYYALTTATDGDGALPGKYKVTIESKNVDLSEAKAKSNSAALRQDDVAKANKKAKNLVPPKYSLPDTSGLEVEVTGSMTKDFDLKD